MMSTGVSMGVTETGAESSIKLTAADVPELPAESVCDTVTDFVPSVLLSCQLEKLNVPAAHVAVCPAGTAPPRFTVRPASQLPVSAVPTVVLENTVLAAGV